VVSACPTGRTVPCRHPDRGAPLGEPAHRQAQRRATSRATRYAATARVTFHTAVAPSPEVSTSTRAPTPTPVRRRPLRCARARSNHHRRTSTAGPRGSREREATAPRSRAAAPAWVRGHRYHPARGHHEGEEVLGPSQLGRGDQLHRERVGPADSPPCPVEAVDPVVVERSDGALDHRGERDDHVVDRPGAPWGAGPWGGGRRDADRRAQGCRERVRRMAPRTDGRRWWASASSPSVEARRRRSTDRTRYLAGAGWDGADGRASAHRSGHVGRRLCHVRGSARGVLEGGCHEARRCRARRCRARRCRAGPGARACGRAMGKVRTASGARLHGACHGGTGEVG